MSVHIELMEQNLLTLHRISKSFPGVHALREVDLDLQPGEIHALVGENGAGKSTLIKILAGIHPPDSGEILHNGNPVRITDPIRSRALGIAVIHQELDLFPDLSLTENLFLGRGLLKGPGPILRWKDNHRRARDIFQQLGEKLPPETAGRALSAAQRQMVEIAAALAQQSRIIVMDEPTASLTEREVRILFDQVENLKRSGAAILYVTHRMNEVFAIADRVTVLRDGQRVLSVPTRDTNRDEMIHAMVGRDVSAFFPKEETRAGDPALQVRDFTDQNGAFHNIYLTLHHGEIVGLYGLVGAGRSELAQAIFGLRKSTGEIELEGNRRLFLSPGDALDAGVVYVPEDRLVQGLFHDLTVRDNMTIAILRELSRYSLVDRREERNRVTEQIAALDIRTRGPEQVASTLSGGNQQKVVLGRWLLSKPRVLILDEPTRGVDVGAKAEIHRLMSRLASEGMAILLISSELPEVLGMSDRIGVMREGRLVAQFQRSEANEERVGRSAFPEDMSPKTFAEDSARQSVAEQKSTTRFLKTLSHRRETILTLFLLGVVPILAWLTPGFATVQNVRDILTNISVLSIAATGMTLVIVAGGIDISVGAILAASATCAALLAKSGWEFAPILLAACLAGGVLGFINGGVSVFGRVHPIIVTLGTMGIYRGLIVLWTRGRWVMNVPETLTDFGQGNWLAIPIPVWTAGMVVILFGLALRYLEAGRMVYASGSNPRAARLIGIHSGKVLIWTFTLCGLLTGLGGVIYAGRYGEVQTNTGIGFELKIIAATVIGGTNIMGGSGSVFGSLLGSLLLGILSNAMVLLHISTYWEGVAVGVFILGAVVVDTVRQQRGTGS
ncbi:MAG TPA: ATP-binding cassette domain-containing protein [bacterium]|nr:ATP-binding cassette domain-containing protein [bacterium]